MDDLSAQELRELLETLLARQVILSPADPLHTREDTTTRVVATYVDDRLNLTAVVAIDLRAAAALATSVALVPPARAGDILDGGHLTGELSENLREVLNVMSVIFNSSGTRHVRLHQVHGPHPAVPAYALALAAVVGHRLDVEVDVTGYGAGAVSAVIVT